MKNFIKISCLALIGLMGLQGCNEDDVVTCFTCLYEKRSSSCSSSSFGPWEEGEAVIDFELKDGLTPSGYCNQAYPANDIECAGGCVLVFNLGMSGLDRVTRKDKCACLFSKIKVLPLCFFTVQERWLVVVPK